MERQGAKGHFDPEALIRAEAFIAGYRYATGKGKLDFYEEEKEQENNHDGDELTRIEQMIVDACDMAKNDQ